MHRDDNYFIKIGDRWGLVSGPWFDILERSRHNNVRMPVPMSADYAAIRDGGLPDYQPFTTITWRREKWTNGISRRLMEALKWTHHYETVTRARMHHAWICEDGLIVPATLNTIGEAGE